jgi:hypothetical protein
MIHLGACTRCVRCGMPCRTPNPVPESYACPIRCPMVLVVTIAPAVATGQTMMPTPRSTGRQYGSRRSNRAGLPTAPSSRTVGIPHGVQTACIQRSVGWSIPMGPTPTVGAAFGLADRRRDGRSSFPPVSALVADECGAGCRAVGLSWLMPSMVPSCPLGPAWCIAARGALRAPTET